MFVFSDKWSSQGKHDFDSNDVGFLKSFYSAGILYVTAVNVVSYPVKEYNYNT